MDVERPKMRDMRLMGEMLDVKLHPLTIEDILLNDSPEKTEVFESLGYYFVVFKADKEERVEMDWREEEKGVTVFLVVFKDGILTFHFDDISLHMKTVQDKIQRFGVARQISSHWICYGLMDSIVDSFFPIVDFLEGECRSDRRLPRGSTRINEKNKYNMLFRIARMRRLVNGLSKLLEGKQAVVTRLRKRRGWMEDLLGNQGNEGLKHDMGIYLGDLEDHVLTMQQSLTFFEVTLAHDHPLYLSVLRLSLERTKNVTDIRLIGLSIVTFTFLQIVLLTSTFSLNVEVPHNGDRQTHRLPDGSRSPFTTFYLILAGIVVICAITWSLAYWMMNKYYWSKRRKGKTYLKNA
ncbi:hypothetical protein BT69DRAFT_1365967 [Atractiella rhizophila]|nr:hypothetical protein BT69DRAFT_1365967 [Atractiella rhizophila]